MPLHGIIFPNTPILEYSLVMGFRENLKDELKYQDIKVKELAEKSGISKRTIDHYLASRSTIPQAEAAVKIAQVLDVSVEYLVTGTESSVPKSIKPEVVDLITEINRLPPEDFELVKNFVMRLKRTVRY